MHLFDVQIAGGGPAGLAAAIVLAKTGRRVLVVDRARPPLDKACGEGLLPDSVQLLRKLGITVPASASWRLRGIRFVNAHRCATADFPDGHGLGVRRTALHSLMLERAVELGVAFEWSSRSAHVQAPFLIGADGQNSNTRQQLGLQSILRETRRYGFRRHYAVRPWTDYVEVHWQAGQQVYITPIGKNEVGVAVLSRDPQLRVQEALRSFPAVAKRLRGAEPCSKEMGGLSVSRRLRSVGHRTGALVGDASGSVDAVTGEGISLALQQAFALASALDRGTPEAYQRSHRSLMWRPRFMSQVLLALDRSALLQRATIRAFSHLPVLFGGLVALHLWTPSDGVAYNHAIADDNAV